MENRKKIIDEILPTRKYGHYFRLVEPEDAEFIVSLRNDTKLSRYINETSSKIEDQLKWIEEYKIREKNGKDFYIICLSEDTKEKLGLNRIYKIEDSYCEFGSWLYKANTGKLSSIFGDLFCKSIIFEDFNINKCLLEVRKKNKSVLRYTKSFNPVIIGENDLSYYFDLDYKNFKKQRDKLLNFFTND